MLVSLQFTDDQQGSLVNFIEEKFFNPRKGKANAFLNRWKSARSTEFVDWATDAETTFRMGCMGCHRKSPSHSVHRIIDRCFLRRSVDVISLCEEVITYRLLNEIH